jgi:hypothetical protein
MKVGSIIGICIVIALPITGAISNAGKPTVSKPVQSYTDSTSTQDTRSRQTHGASDCTSIPPGMAAFKCVTDGMKVYGEAHDFCMKNDPNVACLQNRYRASGRDDFADIQRRILAINEIEASIRK